MTPWTVVLAPLSLGFSRQEYWSGLPCPPPEHLPNLGIEPRFPALQADSFTSRATREAQSVSGLYSMAAFDFHSWVKEHVELETLCWLPSPADLFDISVSVTPHKMLGSSKKKSHPTGQPPNTTRCGLPLKQVAGTSRNGC